MKNHLLFVIILFFLFFSACKGKDQSGKSEQKIDHSAAIPDGGESVDIQLTDSEIKNLANAKGRVSENIHLNDLDTMFKYSEDKLHVYSFWKTNNLDCNTANKTLLQMQQEVGDSTMRLIFVSLDDSSQLPLVNAFIREHSVTSNVFVTSDSLTMDWYSSIFPSWSGEVPAIYLKNKTDGTDLFYQKKFTAEELSTLIEPFTL